MKMESVEGRNAWRIQVTVSDNHTEYAQFI
jgi:hypothetical protein